MTVEAYPLAWPAGWDRTPSHRREAGAFKMPLGRARDGLLAEIGREPVAGWRDEHPTAGEEEVAGDVAAGGGEGSSGCSGTSHDISLA